MLLKTGALSLSLLLLSRILGLLRESAQAAAFGTSGTGDIAVLMLTLPDWLASVLASGALAYVLLPHWATQSHEQQDRAQRRATKVLLLLGTFLAGLLFLLSKPLTQVLVSGLPETLLAQAERGLAISVLALPAALLAALWAVRLQYMRDFVGMLSANLVVNGVLILGLLFIAGDSLAQANPIGLLGLVLGSAMGLRLLWLHRRLIQKNRHVISTSQHEPDAPMPCGRLWVWAGLSAGLPLILPFIARTFAGSTNEGALATFNYAWKLIELPLVLAIQLVATILFPTIARAMAGFTPNSTGTVSISSDAVRSIRGAFLLAWTLACAATTGLLVGAEAVADLLFGWGRMPEQSVVTMSIWSTLGAWCLLPQALIAVSLNVLATLGRMRLSAFAYGFAAVVLMTWGYASSGDGAEMMCALIVGFVIVSASTLVELRYSLSQVPALHWFPWRPMLTPTAALLSFGLATRMGLMEHRGGKGVVTLIGCLVAAVCVILTTYFASRELRSTLRR